MHYTGLDDHGTRYRVILLTRISALKLRNGNNNNRITNNTSNLTNSKINNQYTLPGMSLTMKREQEQKHS